MSDKNNNTGYRNTGNCNTGNWNTGNWNTGYCNTGNGRVELFGKPTGVKRSDLVFPDFFYHDTAAVWVPLSSMTAAEKDEFKSCETTEGYLKKVDPKAGWRTAWDKAPEDDRRKCLALPNWDNEMFKEISGVDVEAELCKPEEMTVADICKALGKNVVIIKEAK